MSDTNRKSFHSKLLEKVTPSIMKTRKEKAKETATGDADTIARDAQPDFTKGKVQEAVDKVDRAKDNTKHHRPFFGRKKAA